MTERRERDLLAVADRLGLQRSRRRWGPCPACRADRTSDRRPPIRIGGNRWWCNACNENGDAVDLACWSILGRAVQKGDSELRQVFDWLDGPRPEPPAVRRPTRKPAPLPGPPPLAELVAALRSCTAPAADPDVAAYLQTRGIDPTRAPAGALPPDFQARWWPRAWSGAWRLVVPAFTGRGELRTLHARAIWSVAPKTRWPLDCDARGVVFADQLGRALLRGTGEASRLIVGEGLTDFLRLSAEADGTAAVICVESGSESTLSEIRLPPGLRVYVATHADIAGDHYAEAVGAAIAPHPYRRVPLDLLRRRAA